MAKLLRFQGTFYKKSFVSGFGAEAPTDNKRKKHGIAVLFYIINIRNILIKERDKKIIFLSLFCYNSEENKRFRAIVYKRMYMTFRAIMNASGRNFFFCGIKKSFAGA